MKDYMNTTFIITGGIGRVICSMPALEKYHKLNPNDDFKILVPAWEHVFFSNPTLQQRVFNSHHKGLFDQVVKNTNVLEPEPYRLNKFFNKECNLVEAFDACINQTNDHSNLNYNCLYLTHVEKNKAKDFLNRHKKEKNKNKVVVFQPFGSSVEVVNNTVVDRSNRSMMFDHYLKIAKELSKDSVVLFASQPELRHSLDNITISFDEFAPYIRALLGMISECDYYVGVCSVGQHVARAFNKKGLILMGGTDEKNFSYPDHFDIYRKKDRDPLYSPWRLCEGDCEFSDRMNEGLMNFTDNELSEIITKIKLGMNSGDARIQQENSSITIDDTGISVNYG